MTNKIRALKSRSVSHSLQSMDSYQSNQGQVWHSIDALCEDSGSYSHTSAMKAAYLQTADSLAGYREAFPMLPNQRGVVVYLNGRVASSELVSRSKAYAQLHDKLLDSFALDAVVERRKEESTEISKEHAESFLCEVPSWRTESFKSVGLGEDLRMENCDSHGNALLVEEVVVHAATFNHAPSQMEL